MPQTVIGYAAMRRLSPQRVRELAKLGKIQAEKHGGRWVITDEPQKAEPGTRRRLSARSQENLIVFLNTLSFDHVHGTERRRLAERLRELEASSSKARLIREYFRGATFADDIRGGGAIVLAALEGRDEQVENVLRLRPQATLSSPTKVAKKLRDVRVLSGESVDGAASKAGVSPAVIRQLERSGSAPRGNLDALKVFVSLGYRPSTLSADHDGVRSNHGA